MMFILKDKKCENFSSHNKRQESETLVFYGGR